MGVDVLGIAGEVDGYGDSMEAFRTAHASTANQLLNLAEGKKKNAPRAAYDPDHPDNQWPIMVYHPEKGELTVGKSVVGLDGNRRREVTVANQKALDQALTKDGYRKEPYLKPQIAVHDPAVEKAALQARIQEQDGKIVALSDLVQKLIASQGKG